MELQHLLMLPTSTGQRMRLACDSGIFYEVKDERSGMSLIAMQPLVPDLAYMPHIKAIHIPFQMVHGSFICHQRLQSGRPKCWITLSDFLFPFHNLTWGFCFCLHIIPLFCRFGGDKHPGTADISFYPNSMGLPFCASPIVSSFC